VSDASVGILNLDIGNLRSVGNAAWSLGFDHRFVTTAEELDDLTHLIIPGVGAFHAAMHRLADTGTLDAVRRFKASGRPLLGLCLGMQLLTSLGEEGSLTEGLGFIGGRVARLDEARVPSIPHVGWNSVEWRRSHPVTAGVKTGVDFYFVHSYRVHLDSADDALGCTDCGEVFPSVIAHRNVIGFQFHPEKSQANGLKLIANFCDWDGKD